VGIRTKAGVQTGGQIDFLISRMKHSSGLLAIIQAVRTAAFGKEFLYRAHRDVANQLYSLHL
jgi:hypothetical protein